MLISYRAPAIKRTTDKFNQCPPVQGFPHPAPSAGAVCAGKEPQALPSSLTHAARRCFWGHFASVYSVSDSITFLSTPWQGRLLLAPDLLSQLRALPQRRAQDPWLGCRACDFPILSLKLNLPWEPGRSPLCKQACSVAAPGRAGSHLRGGEGARVATRLLARAARARYPTGAKRNIKVCRARLLPLVQRSGWPCVEGH